MIVVNSIGTFPFPIRFDTKLPPGLRVGTRCRIDLFGIPLVSLRILKPKLLDLNVPDLDFSIQSVRNQFRTCSTPTGRRLD